MAQGKRQNDDLCMLCAYIDLSLKVHLHRFMLSSSISIKVHHKGNHDHKL